MRIIVLGNAFIRDYKNNMKKKTIIYASSQNESFLFVSFFRTVGGIGIIYLFVFV